MDTVRLAILVPQLQRITPLANLPYGFLEIVQETEVGALITGIYRIDRI